MFKGPSEARAFLDGFEPPVGVDVVVCPAAVSLAAAVEQVAQSHKVRTRATQPVGAESYYGRPILKEPTWTWEVPLYLFAGGIAGGSAALAAGARFVGNDELSRRATLVNLAAISASPALLASELGRPDRFLHMLRVVKPTSPMNMVSPVSTPHGSTSSLCSHTTIEIDSGV